MERSAESRQRSPEMKESRRPMFWQERDNLSKSKQDFKNIVSNEVSALK